MLGSLKCTIFGHADTERTETQKYTILNCTRCGRELVRELTYQGAAIEAVRDVLRMNRGEPLLLYDPVEEVEDAEGRTLTPGDKLLYLEDSVFPGLPMERTGTVEFLYQKAGRSSRPKYAAKVRGKDDIIMEDKWKGIGERGQTDHGI